MGDLAGALTARADSNALEHSGTRSNSLPVFGEVGDGAELQEIGRMRFWFRWPRFESWRRSGWSVAV